MLNTDNYLHKCNLYKSSRIFQLLTQLETDSLLSHHIFNGYLNFVQLLKNGKLDKYISASIIGNIDVIIIFIDKKVNFFLFNVIAFGINHVSTESIDKKQPEYKYLNFERKKYF